MKAADIYDIITSMSPSFRIRPNKAINAFLALWLILGFGLIPVLDAANDLHALEHAVTAENQEGHGHQEGHEHEDRSIEDVDGDGDEGSSAGSWHQLMHSGYTSAQSTAAVSEALLVPAIRHAVIVYPPDNISSPAPFRQNLFRPPIA